MKKSVLFFLTVVMSVVMTLSVIPSAFALDERSVDAGTADLVVVYSDEKNDAVSLDLNGDIVEGIVNLENGIDVIKVDGAKKDDILKDVSSKDNVEYAFYDDFTISACHSTLPNDPGITNAKHYYQNIQADETWSTVGKGKTVVVAVIDTGIEKNCTDMSGRVTEYKDMYAEVKKEEPCAAGDISGHGTSVANIIAGIADNNIGSAGISGKTDVKIISYRCGGTVSDKEYLDPIAFLQALKDINENHPEVDVVNMSFGFVNNTQSTQNYIDAIQTEFDQLSQKNVILCSSSGNSGSSEKYYPASCDHVYAVGAVDESFSRSSFSTYNEDLDFVAPGENIPSVDLNNTLIYSNGTSYASSVVSGAFAYLLSSTDASPKEIEKSMTDNAKDLGKAGKDSEYRNGIIQLKDTYESLMAATSVRSKDKELSTLIGEIQQKKIYSSVKSSNGEYIVTFYPENGSDTFSVTVSEKAMVNKPKDPSFSGHTFKGWAKKGDYDLYDFSTPVTSDIALIAKWSQDNVNTGIYWDSSEIIMACVIVSIAAFFSVVFIIRKKRATNNAFKDNRKT